jgi:protein TonB
LDAARSYGWRFNASSRLNVAILASVVLHAVVLFGITFKFPLPRIDNVSAPLEVVLTNNEPSSKPDKIGALPQARLDRGGNASSDHRAKTPFSSAPPLNPSRETAASAQKVEQPEQETQQMMAAVNSDNDQSAYQTDQAPPVPEQSQQEQNNALDTTDLIQRGVAIARVAAQNAGNFDLYQKPPRRRFVGARTRDYRFARYAEDWRLKVERIGNLNYPEAAKREQLYGKLQLTVSIKSDGTLESVEINRPSGKKVLDEAAIRIVKLAGQNGYAPFPPDISRDTDILHITRTWVFTGADELTSE